jgi:signal transduction histidine kinase
MSHREPGSLVLDISDDGAGIPEEQQTRVFEPFYGLPGSRETNAASTGVGLAIVRRAIERAGGTVGIVGGPPGTTFRLVLPVPTAAAPSADLMAVHASTHRGSRACSR